MGQLLAEPAFRSTRQSGRLLRYLMKEAGKEEGISSLDQYRVGVEGLGLPADFDPRSRSVVRVAMSRLRRELREYYRGPGAGEPLRIRLAEAGYHLCWERSDPGAGEGMRRSRLRIEPFAGWGLSEPYQSLPRELSRECAGWLAGTGRVTVVAPNLLGSREVASRAPPEDPDSFLLRGSLEECEGALLLRVYLQAPEEGVLLDHFQWSFSLDPLRQQAIGQVLQAFAVEVASEFGLIDRYLVGASEESVTGGQLSLPQRFLLAQVLEGRFSSERLRAALSAVEEGLVHYPHEATLLGASAILQVLGWQDDPEALAPFPYGAGERVARALSLDPTGAVPRLGEIFVAMAEANPERLDSLSRDFLEDSSVSAHLRILGANCRLVADLDPAGTLARVDELFAGLRTFPRVFHSLRGVHEYREGRLRAAFAEVERASFEVVWFDSLLRGLIAMDLGWGETAREERGILLAAAPGFADRPQIVLGRIFAAGPRDFLLARWQQLLRA